MMLNTKPNEDGYIRIPAESPAAAKTRRLILDLARAIQRAQTAGMTIEQIKTTMIDFVSGVFPNTAL